MGDFAGREPSRATVISSSSSAHAPEQTPEQAAHFAVGSIKHRVDVVVKAKVELDAAHAANAPARWADAKKKLERAVVEAHRALDRSASTTTHATDADKAELAAAKVALTTTEALGGAAEPPLGYARIVNEDLVLAVIHRHAKDPSELDAALVPVLDELSSVDLQILRDRIARKQANDKVTAAIWALGPARRDHVSHIIDKTNRDKKLALAAARNNVQIVPGQVLRPGMSSPGDDPFAEIAAANEPSHPELDRFDAAVKKVSVDYRYVAPAEISDVRAASQYLHLNANRAWQDLAAYCEDVVWPELGTDELAWVSERLFSRRLLEGLRMSMPGMAHEPMLAVLYPHDPFALVDALRPDKDRTSWIPAIGLALGQYLQRVVAPAIMRVAPRIASVAGDSVELSQGAIAFSHAMDPFVFEAMRKPGAIAITPDHQRHEAVAVRPVKLMWQGETDEAVWNWVRADPVDATAEEVIAQIALETGRKDLFAAALAVAPPLFGLPLAWAKKLPKAAVHMPKSLPAKSFEPSIDTPEARLLELSRHGAAAQTLATDVAPTRDLGTRQDVEDQLATLHDWLVPWACGELATVAIDELHASTRTQFSEQKTRLKKLGQAIRQLEDQYETSGPVSDNFTRTTARKDSPLRPFVRRFASAVAASHNPVVCDALYAAAMRAQAELAIDALQVQMVDAAAANGVPMASNAYIHDKSSVAAQRYAGDAETAIAAARITQTKLINGAEVSGAELFDSTLETREAALRAKLTALFDETGQLQVAAADAESGLSGWLASLGSKRFRTLRDVAHETRLHVDRVQSAWTMALQEKDAAGNWIRTQDIAKRREAIAKADTEYAKIHDDDELITILKEGPQLIRNQQLRRALISVGTMIVVTIATMGIGAVAEAGIGATMMTVEGAESLGELSMMGRLMAGVGRSAIEVGGNSVGQSAIDGTSIDEAILNNLLFAGVGYGTAKLTGPIKQELAAIKAARAELSIMAKEVGVTETRLAAIQSTTLKSLGWVAVHGGSVSGETIVNIAVANVAARLQGKTPTPTEATDLYLQALSVSVGRAVHATIGKHLPNLEKMASSREASARDRRLLSQAQELERLALGLANGRIAKLDAANAVYEQQTKVLKEMTDLAEARAQGGDLDARAELTEMQQQQANVRVAALVEMRFALVGCDELIPGKLWSGTKSQVDRLVTELSSAHRVIDNGGASVRVLDVDGHVYRLQLRPEAPAPEGRPVAHELSTDLDMVPGSSFRGSHPGSRPTEAQFAVINDAAIRAMPEVALDAGVKSIQRVETSNRFVVELATGGLTMVDVTVVRLPDYDVARLIPNSSHDSVVDGREVKGEHTVQLSVDLPVDQVERALAHAVARLTAAHVRAQGTDGAGGTFANGKVSERWTAEDLGRVAELRALVRQLSAQPDRADVIRGEILALADHLGAIGDNSEAADARTRERREMLETQLTKAETAELERAARAPVMAGHAALDEMRSRAREDLAADLHREVQRGNDRPKTYDLAGGAKIGAEELHKFAVAAERLRHLQSEHTLQKLRSAAADAARTPARYARVGDVQVGGGAALAARTPTSLLVDARGRWQSDAGDEIAQTGQQLQELYKAKFGDVRQVAGPKERVPLDAIRFWEDSIAAMGDVIDGKAAERFDGNRLLMDITLASGEIITVEVTGRFTTAPGFVPEAVPGAPRVNMVDTMTMLDTRLAELVDDAKTQPDVAAAAESARQRLRAIDHPRPTSGDIERALDVPNRGKLEDALKTQGAGQALAVAKGGAEWEALQLQAQEAGIPIVFGDDANLAFKVEAMLATLARTVGEGKPIHVVFGGAGGTAVSGAEILLEHPNVHVTMLGADTPAGLMDNPQFRAMAIKHGDEAMKQSFNLPSVGDGRLKIFIKEGLRLGLPVLREIDGKRQVVAHDSPDDGTFSGDAYVFSAGRVPSTPMEISDLILQVKRAGGRVTYKADFSADGRFTGYSVSFKLSNGPERTITVTGAATRFIPLESPDVKKYIKEPMREKIDRASGARDKFDSADVPAATGGFPGGFAGSSIQAHGHAARDNKD